MDTRIDKITDRQIARLLSRLEPLKLPDIAIENIKRYMRFLAEDIGNMDSRGDTDEREIY